MQNLYDGETNWQIKSYTKVHTYINITVSDYVQSHIVRTPIDSWLFWFTNNPTIESMTCKSKISFQYVSQHLKKTDKILLVLKFP